MTARKCIFCLELKSDREFSKEHVFPESIGGRLVIDSVCVDCNSLVGHRVDSGLVNNFFVQYYRHALGLAGKSGSVPHPLVGTNMRDNAGRKIRCDPDAETGVPRPRYLPSIKCEMRDDDSEHIEITVDQTDVEKLLEISSKILTRKGQPTIPAEDILAQAKQGRADDPYLKVSLKIDWVGIQLGMLKIAYELAALWIGTEYLDDPTADLIRRSLLAPDPGPAWTDDINVLGSVQPIERQAAVPWWDRERTWHIGLTMRSEDALRCYVRIFCALEARFAVTREPARYHGYVDRFVAVDGASLSFRECTLAEELARVRQQPK